MALQNQEDLMPLRAADDFETIGAKYKELIAVPERKRSSSGHAGEHCAHCPEAPDVHCGAKCQEEGERAGVIP
jgi:hypothetical protein